ncbi:MAG: hypothetical protein EOM59_14745 [Clostridia bacterium]|nr:hypothetical protein [Clostridia bacterium]NCD09741.1 hypothetical protein [Negativicutes bacterium]
MKCFEFKSRLAPQMAAYLQQRQKNGFKVRNHGIYMQEFDQMVLELADTDHITKGAFDQWDSIKPYLTNRTKIARHNIIRSFAKYMFARDGISYVPDTSTLKSTSAFSPYIFTKVEIHRLISASDNLAMRNNAPARHLVIPTVLRMLYSCGFRINELLELKIRDVDFENGTVMIRHAKGGKDRIVPMHDSMLAYLKKYREQLVDKSDDEWLFKSPYGHYSRNTIYENFRELLFLAGIKHRGRGHGPRVHDLRHTYAVHSLESQLTDGYSPMEILPRLAAYMGHCDYRATCVYLHLTAEIFPELTNQIEAAYSTIIPALGGVPYAED